MKKNKLVSLLTRWEVFLLVLLALMCLVFNLQDAAPTEMSISPMARMSIMPSVIKL